MVLGSYLDVFAQRIELLVAQELAVNVNDQLFVEFGVGRFALLQLLLRGKGGRRQEKQASMGEGRSLR